MPSLSSGSTSVADASTIAMSKARQISLRTNINRASIFQLITTIACCLSCSDAHAICFSIYRAEFIVILPTLSISVGGWGPTHLVIASERKRRRSMDDLHCRPFSVNLTWGSPSVLYGPCPGPVSLEHAAVFSVQHLSCSFDRTAFWTRTPTRSVQVCKTRRGHSVSIQF